MESTNVKLKACYVVHVDMTDGSSRKYSFPRLYAALDYMRVYMRIKPKGPYAFKAWIERTPTPNPPPRRPRCGKPKHRKSGKDRAEQTTLF